MLTFAALISSELLVKLAIFGAVAAGAWVVMEVVATKKPRAEQRLEEFRDPARRRGEGRDGNRGVTKRADGMARLLEKASPKLSRPLQPKSEEEVGKLRAKLNYAGFRGDVTELNAGRLGGPQNGEKHPRGQRRATADRPTGRSHSAGL